MTDLMQKLLLLLFVTFITLSSSGQTSKEKDFAQRTVAVFKSKNFDSYKQLAPTKADFEKLYNDKGMIRGLSLNNDEHYNHTKKHRLSLSS